MTTSPDSTFTLEIKIPIFKKSTTIRAHPNAPTHKVLKQNQNHITKKSENQPTNLKTLKPSISLSQLLKQHEAVLRPNHLHVLIQCRYQRPLITEIPHQKPNQLFRLRALALQGPFFLGVSGIGAHSVHGFSQRVV